MEYSTHLHDRHALLVILAIGSSGFKRGIGWYCFHVGDEFIRWCPWIFPGTEGPGRRLYLAHYLPAANFKRHVNPTR